ncbi:tRNA (guanine(10)-N(2))-dimethyltransferase [Pyrofollis japonicus]|uniref:tRNA (guanine(10)-N(2))-dimethyltransferase n=1 Tax=Pyrofollis japonicus TaxID=3060460 RepID=UPI00295BC88A|nr:tRNA (guanine(10)-N(2))-dimethyltransferase [Pyrofollis japonicus]BEP18606.1 tRNA (guanine(10)-N(2))-dimethyltransferase [Pyrofollis japonicus]
MLGRETLKVIEERLGYPVEVIEEGSVHVIVPRRDAYRRPDGVYEPAWAPVFYNPRMALNRDLSILFLRAYRQLRGLENVVVFEPLAGSGVRALRYAVEADATVYAADLSPAAVRLASLNAMMNDASERVWFFLSDANEFMAKLARRGTRPVLVDIDPFGSPLPFLDIAIESLGTRGVIAATATDTAPLSGTHPRALRRKYDVVPGRTAWEKEQAVRILAGYIIRRAAAHEYGARILLAYYTDYYVRVFAELQKGARRADESLERLSYGVYCPICNYTGYVDEISKRCPNCGAPAIIVGPLYKGPLCEREIVELMLRESEGAKLAEKRRVEKLLTMLLDECSIEKPYYRLDKICSMLHYSMPKPVEVVEALRRKGFQAARTHFDPRGFKTNAPHNEVVDTVLEIAVQRQTRE